MSSSLLSQRPIAHNTKVNAAFFGPRLQQGPSAPPLLLAFKAATSQNPTITSLPRLEHWGEHAGDRRTLSRHNVSIVAGFIHYGVILLLKQAALMSRLQGLLQ